jgi:hyaluronan synthase
MPGLTTYLLIYGVLALTHILVQMVLAHIAYLRSRAEPFPEPGLYTPSVTIVVPVYNESPWVLARCLGSLVHQDYPDVVVMVADDGSPNRAALDPIYELFAEDGVRVFHSETNVGKRNVQRVAFDEARGEVIVTVDSDTRLEHDAVAKIVRHFEAPGIGAVTGNVSVDNNHQNLLTRLISYRYWMAFHQERAAQSLFHGLMCCSGPFSAYRRSTVEAVKERYVHQSFLGRLCTFGDDRHLTNLVLAEHQAVVFDETARAHTQVPDRLGRYIRQQVRWNKSFYREAVWTFRHVRSLNFYLWYDLTMQVVLPFLLLGALALVAYQAIYVDVAGLWKYVVLIVGIALLRSMYGLLRTRQLGFLLFVSYGFIHVLLLLPCRLYALATLRRIGWGTRGTRLDPFPSETPSLNTESGSSASREPRVKPRPSEVPGA